MKIKKEMTIAAIILSVLLGCKSTPQQPPTPPDPLAIQNLRSDIASGKAVTVGIIGNSIGCGYDATNARSQIILDSNPATAGRMTQISQNNPNIGGWAQKLGIWLKSKNQGSIVWNLSGSGWTTRSHIALNTVGSMANLNPKPTVVFLPLQVNDRLKAALGEPFPTFDEFKANTVILIQSLQSHGITPVLVKEENEPLPAGAGWYPAEYKPQPAGFNGYHAFSEYMAAIDAIGKQYGVEVIDTYTPSLRNPATTPAFVYQGSAAPSDYNSTLMDVNDPVIGFNPIHPNQKGHDLIYTQYLAWLQK